MKLRTVMVVALLAVLMMLVAAAPGFGFVVLSENQMSQVQGGTCNNGMCGDANGNCRDLSCTGTGECTYKSSTSGTEYVCNGNYHEPPQVCAHDCTVSEPHTCGHMYIGKCMGGLCQDAENTQNYAPVCTKGEGSEDCS